MSTEFVVGQRWISNTEASLGLGIILEVDNRRVTLSFPAAAEERTYASDAAPLNRITYKPGDRVCNLEGEQFTVLDTLDHNGVLIYKVSTEEGLEDILPELDLDCFVHFNSPKERLLSGVLDPLKFFRLRYDTLNYQRNYQQSNVVGLLGPRVQLLPHQLYIAHQVASRTAPRVLLADEVGLGKTIEAGLILHQQLQSGLATRALILVPDSLLHQWLVEMLRRFNLNFSVLDEAICNELVESEQNPFETAQLVLCPLSFLVNNEARQEQALSCEWDLLLVDEAHHLEWHPDSASAEYLCVESLARIARGVLLLTATPEQLGLDGHFARLRLLDPDRYYDLEKFIAEEEQFKPVNDLVQELVTSGEDCLPLALSDYLGSDELATIDADFNNGEEHKAVETALNALLDQHGTGRVLFRNTRAAVRGFPKRFLQVHPLTFDEDPLISAPINDWLQIESIFGSDWLELDTRVSWLLDFLKQHRDKKILLICAKAETALTLEEHLRLRGGARSTVFHEGMSLIARDRAAAYFADPDDSAQILICSEIGSEGRNFQFAHHIIMFDLPINPDLLEQRIGRLDRIGQLQDIHVHVPYYQETPQEILLNWYHQGLNAFEQTCAIGHAVFLQYEQQLMDCLEQNDPEEVTLLLQATQETAEAMRQKLHEGRDQLLEMNSCRPKEAGQLIDDLLDTEDRAGLEDFIERSCDQIGIDLEPHSSNAVILQPSEHMRCGLLEGLKEDGVTGTFSRETALSREDMQYLSWEHPLTISAMDYILSGEHGNTALGTVKLKPLKEGTLLLEGLFTVHCIAPAELRLNRYLPATVIRVLVNIDGKDLSHILTPEKFDPLIKKVPLQSGQALIKQAYEMIEALIEHAETHATAKLPEIISEAQTAMLESQHAEIYRLQALAEVNSNIKMEEVEQLQSDTEHLTACISHADVRLDAVRLVMAV